MARCRLCGKTITWGVDPTGRQISLDPSVSVFDLIDEDGVLSVIKTTKSMVLHSSVCSKANHFPGHKRRPNDDDE